ncbi:MAG TPA: hypothetical protein DCS63_10740, partial [Elusimicrobia bacterium]|nr:hypothetical protein [Elusimicrobiota bacterium]
MLFLPVAYWLLPASSHAAVPVKITYQGNIRQNGNLVTGQRNIVFKIYPSSDSIAALWTSPEYLVSISTGVFKVDLAPAITDLTATNWEAGSLWLEIVIEHVALSPRDELTAAPYSVNSLLHSGKRYTTSLLAPDSPAAGDLWFDTTANLLKYWNGSWIISGAGIPIGDNLGNHTAIQALNMSGHQIYNISSATISGAEGLGAAKLRLNPNVEISSTAAVNYGGVYASSHVFINGDLHATKIYGDISGATGLPAGDNLGNHTATQNLKMQGLSIVNAASGTFTQGVTASSFTATGAGINAAQVRLANNVLVSSESSTSLGAGVRVSTNMYVVGFASATKYYGDGSGLTGISGDNLGNHTATQNLVMAANQVTGSGAVTMSSYTATGIGVSAAQIKLSDNVLVSSESSTNLGAGVRVSTNMYIVGFASATKFYGDGSGLTGISGDNLGNHIATTDLIMGANQVTGSGAVTMSSYTATGIGFSGAQIKLSDNVLVSSEAAIALGAGVRVSTNMYIVGFASATKFYGDGSGLTGISGDNLGNHIATKDLVMSNLNVNGANFITASSASFTNAVTASSFTATGIGVSAAQIKLSDNVLVSSEAAIALGAGVRVSTNIYIVGFASATKFYGDGSGLTGISGDNLGNHTATTNLIMGANQLTGSGAVTMSSATLTGPLGIGAAKLLLNPNVELSSTTAANYGGVYASTHIFVNGDLHAAKIYGDGSGLTSLNVAGDNLGSHIATATLNMASWNLVNVSSVNFLPNVFLTSATNANYGGVYASSHVFINGDIRATKIYGDISGASGLPAAPGDSLGTHVATQTLNMAGFNIAAANHITGSSASFTNAVTASSFTATGIGFSGAQIKLSDNVLVSSESSTNLGAGVRVSTNMYVVGFASATRYYGDGSGLTGISGDNLGNHIATKDLAMSNLDVTGANFITASSASFANAVTASSFTATGIGVSAAQIKLSDNVLVSSEASANLGAGVRVSTNMYIVGFASATKFYGDGSGLSGILGDNLGNHIATKDLAMSNLDVTGANFITASSASFTNAVTASSFTATGIGFSGAQ